MKRRPRAGFSFPFAASTPIGSPLTLAGPINIGGPAFGTNGTINFFGSTSGSAFISVNALATIMTFSSGTWASATDLNIINSQNQGFAIGGNSTNGTVRATGPLYASAGFGLAHNSKSANYTTTVNDVLIECTGGAAFTITLVTPLVAQPLLQIIKNLTSPLATITVASPANIDGAASQTITTANGVLGVLYDGTTWNIVFSH